MLNYRAAVKPLDRSTAADARTPAPRLPPDPPVDVGGTWVGTVLAPSTSFDRYWVWLIVGSASSTLTKGSPPCASSSSPQQLQPSAPPPSAGARSPLRA